jgi:hypothetical protein
VTQQGDFVLLQRKNELGHDLLQQVEMVAHLNSMLMFVLVLMTRGMCFLIYENVVLPFEFGEQRAF